ncbi:LysR family transcriptional regulator [Brevifollis gellanilyticus]|uniref:LysR family transcriptional regulator n=1 Tax=Brevifollis gellanilyticus TaxID=748831 RepID=A0A512M8B9_9BACT|nr:LysR family transcriptional regulator [Brevifollis gellanilyticus]GEP42969.1 LysR family transcriptional regulator [Brevifollis gellanilyticus]
MMNSDMELRHLRYFTAVAEALNFTKAAARLKIAQPALSRQVQDLEDEIGVDLLKRSPRGVTLTAEGKLFLEEARDTLKRVEDAVLKVRALARGEYGELQIGYAPSPSLELLPPALSAFRAAAPSVKVVLHDLAGDELTSGLHDGSLELAVMIQPSLESGAGLEFEELRRYPFYVAMPAGHPLSKLKTVTVERLAEEALVAFRRLDYSEYYRILDSIYPPPGPRPRIAVECDGVSSLITEIEIGKGVGLVSEIFQRAAGKRLVYRRLSNCQEFHRVGIARSIKGDVTPAGERFCEILRKVSKSGTSKSARPGSV